MHIKHLPWKSGDFNSTPFQSRIQHFSYNLLCLGFTGILPPCVLWVGSHKTSSNSLKAKSDDKVTEDDWTFKRKKKRKCSHDPFRSLWGWQMLSIYQQGCVEVNWNSPLTCSGEQDAFKDITLVETGHKTSDLPEFAALSSQSEEWPRGTPGQKLGGPTGCIVWQFQPYPGLPEQDTLRRSGGKFSAVICLTDGSVVSPKLPWDLEVR